MDKIKSSLGIGALASRGKGFISIVSMLWVLTLIEAAIINFLVEYDPEFWPRFALPILLMFGAIGRTLNIKYFSYLGWLGIALFIPIALLASLPDPEVLKPRLMGQTQWNLRYITILITSALWIWCYWKLRPIPNKTNVDLENIFE